MIEYPSSVIMNTRQMEIVPSREHDFPYAAIEADLCKYAGGRTPWHWHDHFEITVVHRGRMELRTRQGSLALKEGEGYFLNANVLHQSCSTDSGECAVVRAQLFTRDVLSGAGLIGRRYISAIENCVEMELVPLYPQNAQHAPILREMNAGFEAAAQEEAGSELFICAHLDAVWGNVFRLMQPVIEKSQGQPREDAIRAKQMLSFIYENYAGNITVADIAAAAGICERECFRCFSDIMGITPMEYLNRHRIATAARALASTPDSVAQIAEACGFSNSSYFGKVFRQLMNCTPSQYRRKNLHIK